MKKEKGKIKKQNIPRLRAIARKVASSVAVVADILRNGVAAGPLRSGGVLNANTAAVKIHAVKLLDAAARVLGVLEANERKTTLQVTLDKRADLREHRANFVGVHLVGQVANVKAVVPHP